MLEIENRFFISGTLDWRDWLVNLVAHPPSSYTSIQPRRPRVRAKPVSDLAVRRTVLEHLNAAWYRDPEPIDVLIDWCRRDILDDGYAVGAMPPPSVDTRFRHVVGNQARAQWGGWKGCHVSGC